MKPHTNSKIISEIDNGWLTIWFNSIENRNALSEGLISDLKNLLNKTKINHTI
jgi:enoyl-CoA hydratase/carnithine racemase